MVVALPELGFRRFDLLIYISSLICGCVEEMMGKCFEITVPV